MKRLPVIHDPLPFDAIAERERELWQEIDAMSVSELSRGPILSANTKTSVSLDFSTSRTCRPTEICKRVCYATKPTIPSAVLRRHLQNTALIAKAPTDHVVRLVSRRIDARRREFARRGVDLDFLRICGTGDLLPQMVWVVNALARERPDITWWVVTRRFKYAEQIVDAPNVVVALSIDASTSPADLQRARDLRSRRCNTYLSYLRMTEDDVGIPDARIVFDHGVSFNDPWGGKQCPVDAGTLRSGNIRGKGGTACATCRMCFTRPSSDDHGARQEELR
jgi:hypothetical protein